MHPSNIIDTHNCFGIHEGSAIAHGDKPPSANTALALTVDNGHQFEYTHEVAISTNDINGSSGNIIR